MRPPALVLLLAIAALAPAACGGEPRLRLADSAAADSADVAAAPPDTASPAARMAPVWQAAADSGYTFRAVGQEPGWLLTIHPVRGIHYLGQYGDERLDAPPTDPVGDGRGTRTWLATTAVGALAITVEEKPCADAMSGEPMTHRVSVSVAGHTVHGCGRDLAPRAPSGRR